jgi:hypothetical protein
MRVLVRDLIGNEDAITLSDGQMVYDRIHPVLVARQTVELDFAGVDVFGYPFFNASIGQLLRDIEPDDLNRLLSVSNLGPVGDMVLRRVIQNAKRYYRDPDYRKAVDQVIETMSREASGRTYETICVSVSGSIGH